MSEKVNPLTKLRKAGNIVTVDDEDGETTLTVRRGTQHRGERPPITFTLSPEPDEPDEDFQDRLAEAAKRALKYADSHAKMVDVGEDE